jgi:galactose mutarotase-like enzyme
MQVQAITMGAIITSIRVPDRNGKIDDVVLGYDTLDPYVRNPSYFGAIVGRYANRIANGKFTLDGKEYTLPRTTVRTISMAAQRDSISRSGTPKSATPPAKHLSVSHTAA